MRFLFFPNSYGSRSPRRDMQPEKNRSPLRGILWGTMPTIIRKIWDRHVVTERPDGRGLLYIDRHLVHEVTSPQAFEALRLAGRKIRRPLSLLAVPDHNVPTSVDRLGRVGGPARPHT